MRSLFWRSFLAFWLGMAAILAGAMALTAAATSQRFKALDGLNPATLAQDARQLAALTGRAPLERWIHAVQTLHPELRVYVLDGRGQDLLARALPGRLENWRRTYQASQFDQQNASLFYGTLLALSEPLPLQAASWWTPQPLALPDGEPLLLLFLPFDHPQWEFLGLSYEPLSLLLLALAVSLPLCWALTRYVTNPVRRLRETTQALAEGRLQTRAPRALANRRDELGRLARDFNTMAARIQALVDAREHLLRHVAHELRSPLARQQLALALARRKDERLDVQLDRIEREAGRLDELIGQTLQLTRVSAADGPRETLDLCPLIDQLVEDARFEARTQGSQIDWHCSHRPVMASVHPPSLRSAIENLLRNSLRHAGQGAHIQISLTRTAQGLCIRVDDDGPGVPAAALERIFEPFYRVPPAAGEPATTAGSGLGLAIARACLQAHDGSLEAQQPPGRRGLSMIIRLPG